MSNEFMREERYIVFKMSDLGDSPKGGEIRRLAREYAEHLEQLVKKPLDYVVVGAGWSEYGPALRAIEVHVTGAQPLPSSPGCSARVRCAAGSSARASPSWWLQTESRACEKAEVKDAHFHDIRAATATDARAAGMDSRTLLGHTTESSHNRYLRSKIVPVAQPVPARRVRKS